MFTLVIYCLTTSNLPWFMDLTFQVPMQYCSLQHRTLLLSPVASTTACCFCFGSIPSFFLELFLHWSPVAYWAPTNLGNSSFSILSFCLFILFMGFSRQEYWSGLPFPSPVDHILSDLSTLMVSSAWSGLYKNLLPTKKNVYLYEVIPFFLRKPLFILGVGTEVWGHIGAFWVVWVLEGFQNKYSMTVPKKCYCL